MTKIYNLDRLLPDNSLRPEDEPVIETIVQSIQQNEPLDIRVIARKTFSSPASISRLAKRGGFNNFKEMIFFLSKEFGSTELEKIEVLPFVSSSANPEEISQLLQQTFSDKRIYLYGEGFCQFLVNYLYRKLLLKKIYAVDLDGVEISLVSNGLPHTLFIFSQSGENSRGLIKIEECKKSGGKVVAFTASKNSRFTQEADLSFIIDNGPDKLERENQGLNYFYGNCLNLLEYLVKQYAK
ncbi:MurR/RpiR family transcriptional regulator [Lactovum odontotermitis]